MKLANTLFFIYIIDTEQVQTRQLSKLLLLQEQSRFSSLYQYEIRERIPDATQIADTLFQIPDQVLYNTGISSCKCIMDHIATAQTAHELVSLFKERINDAGIVDRWIIEYECLSALTSSLTPTSASTAGGKVSKARAFTAKTLMCALSQCVNGQPSLNPEEALCIYRILETAQGLYLGLSRVGGDIALSRSSSLSSSRETTTTSTVTTTVTTPATTAATVTDVWKSRPFSFSASLSVELAETVCRTLMAKVAKRKRGSCSRRNMRSNGNSDDASSLGLGDNGRPKTMNLAMEDHHDPCHEFHPSDDITLYDPCCGSGTTLYVARGLGMKVVGADVNIDFARGTQDNLIHAGYQCDNNNDNGDIRLFVKDASRATPWRPLSYFTTSPPAEDTTYTASTLPSSSTSSSSSFSFSSASSSTTTTTSPFFAPLYEDDTKIATISTAVAASTSTTTSSSSILSAVDCVFCNFPWGENIFEYHHEVDDILLQLGKELKSGCVCAFVTKRMLDESVLESAGFTIEKIIPVSGEQGSQKKVKKNTSVAAVVAAAAATQIAGDSSRRPPSSSSSTRLDAIAATTATTAAAANATATAVITSTATAATTAASAAGESSIENSKEGAGTGAFDSSSTLQTAAVKSRTSCYVTFAFVR